MGENQTKKDKKIMEKILHPGKIGNEKVFIKISWDGFRLSITGVIAPRKNGNASSCGQILSQLEYIDNLSAGWNESMILGLYEIWDKFHLNDLQAGCEHQRAFGWEYSTHSGKNCPICGYKIGTEWKTGIIPNWAIEYLFNLPETQIQPAWV